ncbi:hypothetical protein BJV74DRAFT_813920 [Russula compacta]|nr:hypothetical protein BJV74DRAFT_813920 [Russula compacta]
MAHNAGFVFTVVRHLYFALHQGTDSALATLTLPDRRSEIRQHLWTYPLCSIPDHRSGSTSHVHESSVAEVSRPPAAASIDVPHRDSVLANITPSSLLASGLDDSTPRHPDWPSPVIESSSYPTPQLPPSNPTTPLNSASISTQPTAADHPVVLPTATTSVPHSILEATTSIALQRTGSTDHPSLSPSTLPGMSFSSSATPPPSNTHPVDSWSFPTSSSNQTPPNQDQDQGLPPGPTNSGITIPLLARQISSSSGPTIDALGDSRADDSAPDLATDRLVPSRDSVFFPSHDLGRSQ